MALLAWAVVPFSATAVLADINVGLLYILAVSSLGVYGVVISGWASNSKYPFYSAMRAAAQMISYEVSIGFIHGVRGAVRRHVQSERYYRGAEGLRASV